MKKNIIIILTIVVAILAVIAYNVYNYKVIQIEANKNNKTYNSFYEQTVLGTDVASLINKATNSNNQNSVQKDENGKYIDNDKNSIKIEIKFLEIDKVIPMESINKQEITQFVQNFGAMSFKCIKIEYHKATDNIKYMYFEQVEN